VFFLLLVLAAGRTLYLGSLHSGTLRRAARSQQLTYEKVPAQRGTITDRNGVDLAISEPAQDVSATPYLIKSPLAVSRQLAPLLGRSQTQVLARLSERSGFVYLARSLPAERARQVLKLKIEGRRARTAEDEDGAEAEPVEAASSRRGRVVDQGTDLADAGGTAWSGARPTTPLGEDSLLEAKQGLADSLEEFFGVLRQKDVLDSIGEVDRANLAKYLMIAKLRLENAIAMVRSGEIS